MKHAMRGFTLVELMVGIAVGLLVVAAATLVLGKQLHDYRRLMLETQVQQDLRAAADIVVRELRRSGYWGSAHSAPGIGSNPYDEIAVVGNEVAFSYSHDELTPARGSENDRLDHNEALGLRLHHDALELLLGEGNWQQLTDPAVLRITRFDIEPHVQEVELSVFCDHPCTAGSFCVRLQVRTYEVVIEGQAVADAKVRRTLRASVRPRNEPITGSCPA